MGDVTREQALEAARRLSRYDWQDWTAIDIEDAASIVRAYSALAMPPAHGVDFTREWEAGRDAVVAEIRSLLPHMSEKPANAVDRLAQHCAALTPPAPEARDE